jgi:iron only hydrogenase large subunit-like protein
MKSKNNNGTAFDVLTPEGYQKMLKDLSITPAAAVLDLITSDAARASQKAVASVVAQLTGTHAEAARDIIASMLVPSEAIHEAARRMVEDATQAGAQIAAWAEREVSLMTEDERAEFIAACKAAPLDPDAIHAAGVM